MCLPDYAKMMGSGDEGSKGGKEGEAAKGKKGENGEGGNGGNGGDGEDGEDGDNQNEDESNGGLVLDIGTPKKKKTCLDNKTKKDKKRFCSKRFLGE